MCVCVCARVGGGCLTYTCAQSLVYANRVVCVGCILLEINIYVTVIRKYLSGTPVRCCEQLWCFTQLWSSHSACRWLFHRTNGSWMRESERDNCEWGRTNRASQEERLLGFGVRKQSTKAWKKVEISVLMFWHLVMEKGALWTTPPHQTVSSVFSLTTNSTEDSDPVWPPQSDKGHIPMQDPPL